jgi:hypothetical protein
MVKIMTAPNNRVVDSSNKEMSCITMNLSHLIIIKRLHKGIASICFSPGKAINTNKRKKTRSSSNHKHIGRLKAQIKLDGTLRPR